jgi:hypothetical protein
MLKSQHLLRSLPLKEWPLSMRLFPESSEIENGSLVKSSPHKISTVPPSSSTPSTMNSTQCTPLSKKVMRMPQPTLRHGLPMSEKSAKITLPLEKDLPTELISFHKIIYLNKFIPHINSIVIFIFIIFISFKFTHYLLISIYLFRINY